MAGRKSGTAGRKSALRPVVRPPTLALFRHLMTRVESSSLQQTWTFWQWPVVWLLAAVALVLGVIGFARLPGVESQSFADWLYLSLQLFVLNCTVAGPLNWELHVARYLAPAVAAYTAVQALLTIFHEQIARLRLRVLRGHAVVCGLGRTGYMVAADFAQRGIKVVVIEQDGETDWIAPAEDLGALVLIGDAAEEVLLRQARVAEAGWLVIVCGDDGANVEIAIRACEVKQAADDSGRVLQCHMHIVDDDLRALFKAHRVFTDTGDRFKVTLFNIYDTSARLLVQDHPLDREQIGPEDPRTVHLIVIGFGHMGESVVLQAARTGHFANGRRLRITITDQFAPQRRRSFYARNPQFDHVCDVAFVELGGDDPEVFARVRAWCAEPDTLPTVVVCFDDDSRCLSFALSLLPGIRAQAVPILLRMTTDGGLTALLDGDATRARLGGLVHPFAVIQLDSEHGTSLISQPDGLAMAIHEDYLAQRRKEGETPEMNPVLLPWDELDEDLKDSNRQQADHVPVKLRALGMAVDSTVEAFTPEQVEILARMEHARRNADQFLAGWRFAPGPRDTEEKTSPHLVAWEELREPIREYDREAVRNIPRWLRAGRAS
jgi:hypothetical protein